MEEVQVTLSPSPVLTATMALSVGDDNFRLPRNHTLQSTNKLIQMITSAATTAVSNLVQIRSWRLWAW